MTRADAILESVYTSLRIDRATDREKYQQIDRIVAELAAINRRSTISPKTTGTISERLCELALRSVISGHYKRISDEWNWMADFSITGHPFNLLVSVKSFKAKERLLVSGSGNNLSPCVGWGLFDDPAEWAENRVRKYMFRSFLAIYLPSALIRSLPNESKAVRNMNGKLFLRDIQNFSDDVVNAMGDDNFIRVDAF
jgi:hypothetical protein